MINDGLVSRAFNCSKHLVPSGALIRSASKRSLVALIGLWPPRFSSLCNGHWTCAPIRVQSHGVVVRLREALGFCAKALDHRSETFGAKSRSDSLLKQGRNEVGEFGVNPGIARLLRNPLWPCGPGIEGRLRILEVACLYRTTQRGSTAFEFGSINADRV